MIVGEYSDANTQQLPTRTFDSYDEAIAWLREGLTGGSSVE
jgi:hypothetical protein